ncbi:anoctamin-8-like isoform X2 [Limulus polyphemus]|uniref:Anoctamin n=1 Tax=Limulus polyphemus TaxID=6850 RepID=A0ABM1BL76_LIMPO|nr:anoctamin-8-like isoform X2 [Limulus polyphemus]
MLRRQRTAPLEYYDLCRDELGEDSSQINTAENKGLEMKFTSSSDDLHRLKRRIVEQSDSEKLSHKAKLSLSIASQLIGKRLSSSRQLLAAGQVWKHTVPSHDCDIVMTFPTNASESTLVWLLTKLKTCVPDISVEVRHHRYSGVYVFYFTAPYENLLKGAEQLKLRKQLKPVFGGGMKEFVFEEQDFFENVEDSVNFFSSQERQSIILHFIYSLRAEKGDHFHNIQFVEGQSIIPKCLATGIVSQVLPLHNGETLTKLKKTWVQAFFRYQPLDDVCGYFGVKIAIYFAWLGHYTKALTIPAAFGFFLWMCYYGQDQASEDLCFVVFALFNVLWATLYLELWKRTCAEHAYCWGTLDSQSELLLEPRPLFLGPLQQSKVTGRLEPTYPAWKRNLFRYCVSLPIIAFFLLVVFVVMFLIFELQTWWDKKIRQFDYPFWLTFLPKIFLALVINVLDSVYYRIAHWLNDKENYRLEEEFENHLIVKIVVFQFFNSFLSLFYIAFYLQDMEKLKEQLAVLLITRQVVGNIKESLLPFLSESLKLAKLGARSVSTPKTNEQKTIPETRSLKTDEHEVSDGYTQEDEKSEVSLKNKLTQAEVESSMYKYEGTFEDYLEMFIQFGYVVLFSSAFPLAAFCALLNNVIEIRSDAFKLCMIFQRPFGQRCENIGSWQDAMELMGVIAVIVNCALIGMSGQVQRMFPSMSTSGTIMLIIVLEHIILALKFGIAYAIPDVPHWVATEMAKVEFQRREASKRLQSSAALPDKDQAENLLRSSSVPESDEERATSAQEIVDLSQSAVSSQTIIQQDHKYTNTVQPNVEDATCQTDFLISQSVQTVLEKRRTVTFCGDGHSEKVADDGEKTTGPVSALLSNDSESDHNHKDVEEKDQKASLHQEVDEKEKSVDDSQLSSTHTLSHRTKVTRAPPPCGPELQPGSPVLLVKRKEKLGKKENISSDSSITSQQKNVELEELPVLPPETQETQGKEKSGRHKFSLSHLRLIKKSESQDSDSSSPSPSTGPSVGEKTHSSPSKIVNGRKSLKFPSLKRKKQPLPHSSSLDVHGTWTTGHSEQDPDISGPLRVSSPKDNKTFVFPSDRDGKSEAVKLS